MERTRFHVLAICVASSLAVSACLPDGKDPSEGADTGKANAAYYASTLGNVAIRIQDTIIRDPSWFAKSESSEFNLQAHDIDQPNGLGADIRAAVCFAGGDNNVTQLTWIDGKDESGRFSMKVLGKGAGKIATELRKSIGANQIGTYKGNGTLAMADGSFGFIPTGCRSSELPIGTPVLVFDIQHPAAPKQDVARTEYRTQSCGQDASGRPMRGIMVQSRIITFKANGTVFPDDPSTGWRTEDMGTCISAVDVAITNLENLAGGAAASLNDFAAVSLRDQLHAALANMDCKKVTVQSQATNRSGQSETRLKTIDTCANANVAGITGVTANDAGHEYDNRELSCTGTSAGLGIVSYLPDLPSIITWEPRDTFTNKIQLKRLASKQTLGVNDGQAKLDQWIGDRINCAASETATIPCASIPGAPVPSPRGSPRITGSDSDRTLNPAYFNAVEILANGGVSVRRDVSATDWVNASTLTPRLQNGALQIVSNECEWAKREMVVNCPTTVNAAQQGSWNPTGTPGFRPRTALDDGDLSSGYIKRRATQSNDTDVVTTLLNTDGIETAYKAVLQNGELRAVPDHYRTPLRCARDEVSEITRPLMVYDCGTLVQTTTKTIRVQSYREYEGTAPGTGTWSKPVERYSADQGAWPTLSLVPSYFVAGTILCPVGGQCGSANGATVAVKPSSGLCSVGSASTVAGSGPWSWSCSGSDGGTTASCSANKIVTNGQCGSAHGTAAAMKPSSNLCAVGNASTVDGSGPWSWSCSGSDGGTTASCSANKNSTNGQCGSAHGTTTASQPSSSLCAVGNASAVAGSGPWTWSCSGSDGGTTASCSASASCPVVTEPVCTGWTRLEPGPRDANGCPTAGSCVESPGCAPVTPPTCTGLTRLVPTAPAANGCPTAGACAPCDPDPVCAAGYTLAPVPLTPATADNYGNCVPKQCVYMCPPVVEPVCPAGYHNFGGHHEYDSVHNTNCPTASTCIPNDANDPNEQNACPSLVNVPQNQADCDRQEWNMGPALWYVDGGVDANGCARGGSCHQETFSECAYRNGWNGTDPNVPYGCCNVYAPGTGGACNINGEYTPYGY